MHDEHPNQDEKRKTGETESSKSRTERDSSGFGFDGSSEILVRRAQEDWNDSAWASLDQRYRERLSAYARWKMGEDLRQRFTVDDIIQEAWLRVVASMDQFEYRHPGSLFRWMCRQVDRITAELGRKKAGKRERPAGSGHEHSDIRSPLKVAPAQGRRPASLVANRDLRERILESLEDPSIPDLYRPILRAYYVERRKLADVAEERGVTPDVLRKQKNRGRAYWQDVLNRRGLTLDDVRNCHLNP